MQINRSIYLFIKRLVDILGALIGIFFLLPVFVIIGISIKLEDPRGKIFFNHRRIGKNGREFLVYKFRSMVSNAEEMINYFTEEQKKEFEENFKLKNDPRVTKVGKFIRKTSIDELPQLINILIGNMSFVGPRPIVRKELIKYGENQKLLISVKPGLTGMWQVYGRSDVSYEERIKMDVYYIQNMNLWMDIKIVFLTVKSVFTQKGAC